LVQEQVQEQLRQQVQEQWLMPFDQNITDGRELMCLILGPAARNNHGMSDVELYLPSAYARPFDGPSCSCVDIWRTLGRGVEDGGLVAGAIIEPKLGWQPKPVGEVCSDPVASLLRTFEDELGVQSPVGVWDPWVLW